MAVQYSKAIDSLETSDFPAAERNNIIDTSINNIKIKDILVGHKYNKVHPRKGNSLQQGADCSSINNTVKYAIQSMNRVIHIFVD